MKRGILWFPEYTEPVVEVTGRRKKCITIKKKEKQLKHNFIEERWSINGNHLESSTNICKVAELNDIDTDNFKKKLSKLKTKIHQDKFILTFLGISSPKRINRRKLENQKNTRDKLVVKYFIPSINGDMIPVCLKSFTSITSFTHR